MSKKITNCLGIDIGSQSIHIASVNRESEGLNYIDRILIDGKDPCILIDEYLSKKDVKVKHAVFSLGGDFFFTRRMRLPNCKDEERLKQIIDFEASQCIPFPMHMTALSYQVFATEEDREVDVLLIACKKDSFIAFHKNISNLKNVKSIGISHPATALLDWGSLTDPPEEVDGFTPVRAYVHAGAKTIQMAIPNYRGNLLFQRCIPLGGNHITSAIETVDKSNFLSAEIIKVSDAADENFHRLSPIVENASNSVLERIVTEVRRSLDYLVSQSDGTAVDEIVLTGGSSKFKPLIKALEDRIGIPVTLGPLEQPVCFGLAVQGLGLGIHNVSYAKIKKQNSWKKACQGIMGTTKGRSNRFTRALCELVK